LAPDSFERYAQDFLTFGEITLKHGESGDVLLVKYENLLQDSARFLQSIARFIDMPFSGKLDQAWAQVVSSGNSGRQSSELEVRPRRPFDIEFFREAEQSVTYRELAKLLGYEHLSVTTTREELLSARLLPLERKGRLGLPRSIRWLRNWLLKKSWRSRQAL
jgi:hypothetical protein